MKKTASARYKKGQLVYVRNWPDLATARVTEVLSVNGWPFYEIMAREDASVWIVPRLHLSTKRFSLLRR